MSFIPQPCAAGGSIDLDGSQGISVTGTGTDADPFIVSAIIDPVLGNALSVGPAGLKSTGGGGGGAELFYTVGTPGIAAFGGVYGTPANQFAAADFQTDGINDAIGIQAAIDAAAAFAPPAGLQPTVYILSGLYGLLTSIDTKGIQIKGAGKDFTQIYSFAGIGTPPGTPAIDNTVSAGDILLEDLLIFSQTGAAQTTIFGTGATVYRRVNINATDDSPSARIYWAGLIQDSTIAGGGNNTLIGNGTIENSSILANIQINFDSQITDSDLRNVSLVDGSNYSRLRIVNNTILDLNLGDTIFDNVSILGNRLNSFMATGTTVGSFNAHLDVSHNFIGAGLHLTRTRATDSLRHSNFSFNQVGAEIGSDFILFDCTFIGNTARSITLTGSPGTSDSLRVAVIGNVVNGLGAALNGIDIELGDQFTIVGNNIFAEHYGIFLQTVTFSNISDNFVQGIDIGAGAFDGLFIDACNRLNVQGNTYFSFTGYGINVVSGNDNLVTNNDLKNGGVIASFNDTATATVITAGNRL